MKLYSYFRSSTAYRVRIALNLKGLPYETVPVNLLEGRHRGADYLALNPQGRVPLLVNGDFALTQSLAIIEYLDGIAPEPALVHGTGEHRAYIRQVALAISCDIHPVTNLNVLQYLSQISGADDGRKTEWYRHFAMTGVAAVETLLKQRGWSGDFCLGNQISMADLCLVPQMYNMRRYGLPLDDFPLCRHIEKNCVTLKPFRDAAPESQPDAPPGLAPIHGPDAPFLKAA